MHRTPGVGQRRVEAAPAREGVRGPDRRPGGRPRGGHLFQRSNGFFASLSNGIAVLARQLELADRFAVEANRKANAVVGSALVIR